MFPARPWIGVHAHKFRPERWEVLHSRQRLRYLDPESVLDAIGVAAGSSVAEVGAGSGAFTLPLARRVGERGRVFALDIEPEMLARLRDGVESGRWPQLVVRESREDHLPLEDGSVDAVFMIQVLHELHGDATLREARRVLKPSGLLHVVDWEPVETEVGPPIEHRVAEESARRFVEGAGFALAKRWAAGEANYGLTFRSAE